MVNRDDLLPKSRGDETRTLQLYIGNREDAGNAAELIVSITPDKRNFLKSYF